MKKFYDVLQRMEYEGDLYPPGSQAEMEPEHAAGMVQAGVVIESPDQSAPPAKNEPRAKKQ